MDDDTRTKFIRATEAHLDTLAGNIGRAFMTGDGSAAVDHAEIYAIYLRALAVTSADKHTELVARRELPPRVEAAQRALIALKRMVSERAPVADE